MRRVSCISNLLVLLGTILTCHAQQEPGALSLAYLQKVELRNVAAFEEAFKTHLNWREEKGDTWTWETWQMIRGEELGTYIVSSGGHHWEDFDAQPLAEEGAANYIENVGQYLTSLGSSMSATLTSVSKFPEDAKLTAGYLAHVVEYKIKPGFEPQFREALKRFHEASQKVGWDQSYIWGSTFAGDEPAMFLVMPHKNWSSFRRSKTPEKVVEEAFGRDASMLLFKSVGEAILSVDSSVWLYRPDLSLNMPGN